ncbi:MAG TPA: DUF3567 family protein [Candidatus Krumholzibacteria bacterium]
MHILYDSPSYFVAEFPGHDGIELVDKLARRGGYLEGEVEVQFRASMEQFASHRPSEALMDEFLANYDALLTQSVLLH